MSFPLDYEHSAPMTFGGAMPTMKSFDDSRVVILPVPVDRTTSYVSGTRNGPREILEASSHMELWDEEVGVDVHGVGIFTLPAMELPFGEMGELVGEIRRVAADILSREKFLVTLGGEHSITPPLVSAAAADSRCFKSTPTRTCGTATWARRTITRARCAAASSSRP